MQRRLGPILGEFDSQRQCRGPLTTENSNLKWENQRNEYELFIQWSIDAVHTIEVSNNARTHTHTMSQCSQNNA